MAIERQGAVDRGGRSHPSGGRRRRAGRVEVDDFTIEVIYSGIADMLRGPAASESRGRSSECLWWPAARKILGRVRLRARPFVA